MCVYRSRNTTTTTTPNLADSIVRRASYSHTHTTYCLNAKKKTFIPQFTDKEDEKPKRFSEGPDRCAATGV